MQAHLVVSAGQGSVLDVEQCERGCRLALERADTGLVTGTAWRGWRMAGSRMVKIKCKSLFLREGGLLSFFQSLK
jgi:hypothetical protein